MKSDRWLDPVGAGVTLTEMCRELVGKAPCELAGPGGLDGKSLDDLFHRLVERGRLAGRPPRWRSGSRYLFGYSTGCLSRNIQHDQGYFLSLPSAGFTTERQSLRMLLLQLLSYSAEIVVPLEACPPLSIMQTNAEVRFDGETATGFVELLSEVQGLVDAGLLHFPICHFYRDGIENLRTKMDGLRRLGFCTRDGLDDFYLNAGPELRADSGLSIFSRADLSVDSPDAYEAACRALGDLCTERHKYALWSDPSMLRERRGVFLAHLHPIRIPCFQPTSIQSLQRLRLVPAVARLHGIFERVRLDGESALAGGDAFVERFETILNQELKRVEQDLGALGTAVKAEVADGKIVIAHSALLLELPEALPTLLEQSREINFAAGSGLHAFRHWFDRRLDSRGKWTVALTVRHIHWDRTAR